MKRSNGMFMMPVKRQFAMVSAAQLSSIKREDVIGASDSKWVGSYAKAIV